MNTRADELWRLIRFTKDATPKQITAWCKELNQILSREEQWTVDKRREKLEKAVDGTLIVDQRGEFTLRYGYNSSMDIGNVLETLEAREIPAQEVVDTITKIHLAGVPFKKVVNYLADYYKLFGW